MANTLNITVTDIETTLTSFNQIQVYRAPSVSGVFAELTDTSTRINMNIQDNLYVFIDTSGIVTDFYKTSFFNSATVTTGILSDAFSATALQQLKKNMEVRVELSEDIANTAGVSLGEDTILFFTTTYDPLYCSIKTLRLKVGSFVENVPDDTLNLALFEASLEANILTFVTDASALTSPKYLHARRQWTCCTAGLILLNNLIGGVGGSVRSKSLADWSVTYDRLGVENMLEQLMRCKMTWEPQLNSGFAAVQKPAMVIKGADDPDRPKFGRLWSNRVNPRQPSGNAKIRLRGHRRFKKFGMRPILRGWWNSSD